VYFEARDADYVVREATAAELAQHKAAITRSIKIPVADLAITDLATLDHMRATDVVAYGTKASNLGEIAAARLADFLVPPGFGVPFHYYDAHLRANGLDKRIAAMQADPAFAKDPAVRKQRLAALRKAIVDAPVPPELRERVDAALTELTAGDAGVGVFVRSSTNCEDLPGFSGAGLYDTVPNVKGTDATITAIKQVWASVWNLGAYEDRTLYGIDHGLVFGGVLVEVGINGTAAGVLVTQHPTDPTDDKNYTINAKSGLGLAVVDGRAVPESLIVSWYNHGIRVLSRSAEDTKLVFDDQGGVREVPNPDKGKPVLSNAMAVNLADVAHRFTRLFHDPKLDIEWVFVGDQLYIVQARPYVDR
jgi:phosphoenolpyruvate synthase/pyruvate phosphate dikinase